ncbi:MAG: radical SAM protein [Candidatus Muirbacterium halophilum]|nr:radical SAM protein [Candidatus Muirbacterium halophilum]MCK9474671.1 radical SAM protein [Candidatus Muirbacterium halophilum]
MKIALICRVFENYAFEIFSTILKKKGHCVELFYDHGLFDDYSITSKIPAKFLSENNKFIKDIVNYSPDYILFSIFTDNLKWSLNLSEKLKKYIKNSKIIFGGPHITIIKDEIIKKFNFIDYAVCGAGEHAINDIACNNLNENTIGLIYRKNNKVISNNWNVIISQNYLNLIPDKTLFTNKMPFLKKYYSTFSGFGCPFACSFCIHSTLKKYKNYSYSKKNINSLIDELKIAKKNGCEKVIFHDDVFTINKIWLIEFLKKYKQIINLPFICISHPLFIDDEIAYNLKSSNCVNIEIGTQIMDNKLKKTMLNRNETNKQVMKSLLILKKHNISVTIDHIFGIPEETIENHLKSLRLYKKANISRVILSYLTAYPGISINKILLNKNLISKKDLNKIKNGNVQNFMNYGSLKVNKNIMKTEFLFEWLPFISINLLNTIINKKLYKYLPVNKILSKYIPFFLKTFSQNEFNLEIFIKRYLFFIKKRLGIKL